MTIDKKRIEDEAKHFFLWPHPNHRDTVTLTSCVIFAGTIAEMVRAEERERCALQLERLGQHELAQCLRNFKA